MKALLVLSVFFGIQAQAFLFDCTQIRVCGSVNSNIARGGVIGIDREKDGSFSAGVVNWGADRENDGLDVRDGTVLNEYTKKNRQYVLNFKNTSLDTYIFLDSDDGWNFRYRSKHHWMPGLPFPDFEVYQGICTRVESEQLVIEE